MDDNKGKYSICAYIFRYDRKKNTRKLETQIVFDLISIVNNNNNKEKGAQFKRRNVFNVPCK